MRYEASAGTTASSSPTAPSGETHPPAKEIRPIPLLMRIPVPWVFVLAYLGGVGIQRIVPLPDRIGPWPGPAQIAGIVLMAAGAVIAAWSLALFRTARTTTTPGAVSRQFVTGGPYRYSRNPMYVGLTLFYLGEACLLTQAWPVVVLPLVLFYLQRTVIPIEEARLRQAFGDIYGHYARRVRRWL